MQMQFERKEFLTNRNSKNKKTAFINEDGKKCARERTPLLTEVIRAGNLHILANGDIPLTNVYQLLFLNTFHPHLLCSNQDAVRCK